MDIRNRIINANTKEKRFLDALESLFTGAEVDGDSGFVNLMRMKRAYFRSIRPQLMANIDSRAEKGSSFREELFDKLYTFFHRYFCESGSIYFRHLPAFSKTYERVYADGRDVALSWKTQMLYYVKSDVLVRSMPVELNEEGNPKNTRRFYFDASQVEHKQNNERREFIVSLDEVKREKEGKIIHLKVSYSKKGATTKSDEIIKAVRKADIALTEEQLRKAIGTFRRQTEADFFINKDARGFLREQFDMWLYHYIFQEETIFKEKRIKQLQAIQKTAYNIIDFIAQFEDELRRVWEKPKFVRNVNYVVTLDKLTDEVLQKIAKHSGAKTQAKEWRELGMVDDAFSLSAVIPAAPDAIPAVSDVSPQYPMSFPQSVMRESNQKQSSRSTNINTAYQFLPLDTKHFKDLELEILGGLGNLDEALDGELVHSENWQALNSLQRRYREKAKCIHIDPPYNTKTSGFLYRNEYKHSSWLTMMDNRIDSSLEMLSEDGSFLCHIDENEYERLNLLMDNGSLQNAGTVIWDKKNPMMGAKGIATRHEYIMWRTKHEGTFYMKDTNVQSILYKANMLIKKHGVVNDNARKEFSRWIENNKDLSGGERAYRFIDDEGKVYRGVAMGAPEFRTDKKFHIPIVHPVTKKLCHAPASGWSRTPETIKQLMTEQKIIFGKDETVQPQRKVILSKSSSFSTVVGNAKRGKTDMDRLGLAFPYCHPISLYEELVSASSINSDGVTCDYFAGSGTTAHAVINLNREDNGNRKYLLIEMGEYFHTVLLPRIKKVVYSKDWKDGNPVSHKGSSHFLKYHTLEQYEETLKNARYQGGKQLELDSTKTPFEQYVFFADKKLTHPVKPTKTGKLNINLHDLYPDLDIAESLSNTLGKPIRHRTANNVTFVDGTIEKTNPKTMTEEEKQHFISLIKPYLWWGE